MYIIVLDIRSTLYCCNINYIKLTKFRITTCIYITIYCALIYGIAFNIASLLVWGAVICSDNNYVITVQLKGNLIPTRVVQVGWKLHHVFYIWTGACYICACIRQIIRHVHPLMLHSFRINFVMKFNINYILTMNLRIMCLYVPTDPWINCLTDKLLTCSCVKYLMPYCFTVGCRLAWRIDLE